MDIKNKVVLVTGASSGIGKATALAFANKGADVIVNYRSNEIGANDTLNEIEKYGVKAVKIKADVGSEVDVKNMFAQVEKEFGKLDVLVNNAGYIDPSTFRDATLEEWKQTMDANFFGTMLCAKYALEIMEKQDAGVILNMSSIYGLPNDGNERFIVYSAAKAANINFTKTLAKLVGPNIRVNIVAPGATKTEAWEGTPTDRVDQVLNAAVLKRWVTPEEIAQTYIFMAENDSLTGEVIVVDGGRTLTKSV